MRGEGKLKISLKDFERMRAAVNKVLHTYPVQACKKDNPAFSPARLRWDYFHAAHQYDTSLHHDLYKEYNDNHIETAMKRILGY